MKPIEDSNSRRAFLKTSALGSGGAGVASSLRGERGGAFGWRRPAPSNKSPASRDAVWYTNAKQRFAAGQPIRWQPAATATVSPDSLRIVPGE